MGVFESFRDDPADRSESNDGPKALSLVLHRASSVAYAWTGVMSISGMTGTMEGGGENSTREVLVMHPGIDRHL